MIDTIVTSLLHLLQEKLEFLLSKVTLALKENAEIQVSVFIRVSYHLRRIWQERVTVLAKDQARYPRSSICSYLKQIRTRKSYFVDFQMEVTNFIIKLTS